ncbi:MAG TPA: alpha/beta-hydrolase family protein [Corynebacterium sp.]|nr:alpha/beta-hydrolase family protein [Corynebacterium sp.]
MVNRPRTLLRRCARRGAIGALKVAVFALEVYADLLPGVRMTKRRRLPENMGAGVLGAEAATWWAISPSLLPRPWWVTALNVAFCQGFGHAAGTGVRFLVTGTFDLIGWRPRARVTRRTHEILHAALGTVTATVTVTSLLRQERQAQLVNAPGVKGRQHAVAGTLVGTLGYGALLLIGETTQQSVNRMSRTLSRWLPPVLSWPLALGAVAGVLVVTSDRLVIRRVLNSVGRSAQERNLSIFPGTVQPWEPERSGSPWSYEPWYALGSQGRALVSSGPRARDITAVTGREEVREPIRIYVGLRRRRTFQQQADQVIREMERTGAFRRRTIVLMAAAGTGWLTDWSVSAVEFLTGGDCAIVAMQYSYLPSAVAYITDHDSPVSSSRILIETVRDKLAEIDPDARPRFYVSGESLGAYGIIDSFRDYDNLLTKVDGAVFSGPPRFTRIHRALTEARDPGSPERLPVLDRGRHVRFAAVPEHLEHDFSGAPLSETWESPRIVFAQHASDPITFWDWNLFLTQPAWLREPGSRGVSAPDAQRLDVFAGMRWAPFITGWQVGLDQLSSLQFPGGHAHQYHGEMIHYWRGVLGDQVVINCDEPMARRIEKWIRRNLIKR